MKKIILTLSLLLFACNQDTKEKLVVYQSPTCGCCSGWVANMEQNGFNVEAIKTNDMYNTKVNAGIDMSLSSCHTGFISGYFIEGHVPHDAITKLLAEKPDIKVLQFLECLLVLMFQEWKYLMKEQSLMYLQ